MSKSLDAADPAVVEADLAVIDADVKIEAPTPINDPMARIEALQKCSNSGQSTRANGPVQNP